ncbi:M48 family metalloprotease [Chitinophaga sp. Cy-1792]|uniref:M48 family metalloprotease n=1 Tax=Chitinophaga sp. Cy-1792 TaxID=2608339 RepID=UPI001420E52F|nr:M48 family metallopeptidase [Chitinophaga sp. Cy-1792]NIG54541.1 M48 family metalloprotease [Chitinophaga sp. Cy-1792]
MRISNSLKFVLLLSYIFLAVTATFIAIAAFHPVKALPDSVFWLTLAGATLLCLSGVYWLVPVMELSMNVRRPIQAEEQRLQRCMTILQRKAQDSRKYRLRIIATEGPAAFAIGARTIAVSPDLMDMLDDEELTAVLAHEMGHLRARDTFASAGLLIAYHVPAYIQRVTLNVTLGMARHFIREAFAQGIVVSLLAFLMLFGIAYYFHALPWIMMFLFLGLFFLLLNLVFNFFYRADSRFTEYRRDAFAARLGYGKALSTSLLKISQYSGSGRVSLWYVFFRDTHPILHNRIRKLEKMELKRNRA